MTTIAQLFTVNVQRLLLEGDIDQARKRGTPIATTPLVKPAPMVAAPASVTAPSAKTHTQARPIVDATEPIALPSTSAL